MCSKRHFTGVIGEGGDPEVVIPSPEHHLHGLLPVKKKGATFGTGGGMEEALGPEQHFTRPKGAISG